MRLFDRRWLRPGSAQDGNAPEEGGSVSPPGAVVGDETGTPRPEARISLVRHGFYVISEGDDPRAGTIHGDYVVGFTVEYGQVTQSFASMTEVMEFVALEYRRRQEHPA